MVSETFVMVGNVVKGIEFNVLDGGQAANQVWARMGAPAKLGFVLHKKPTL